MAKTATAIDSNLDLARAELDTLARNPDQLVTDQIATVARALRHVVAALESMR